MIQPGFSSVVIGSAAHTGQISFRRRRRSRRPLRRHAAKRRRGSAGIALTGGLANAGKLLTLSSGGTVTQGAPIVAGSLLLHGTQPKSNFQLSDPLNAVGRFSAHFDTSKAAGDPKFGDVNFVNSGDLDFSRAGRHRFRCRPPTCRWRSAPTMPWSPATCSRKPATT